MLNQLLNPTICYIYVRDATLTWVPQIIQQVFARLLGFIQGLTPNPKTTGQDTPSRDRLRRLLADPGRQHGRDMGAKDRRLEYLGISPLFCHGQGIALSKNILELLRRGAIFLQHQRNLLKKIVVVLSRLLHALSNQLQIG